MSKLSKTANTLEESAVFADYLAALARNDGETEKANDIDAFASDLRAFAGVYRAAAAAT